jgi:hypothetical protein
MEVVWGIWVRRADGRRGKFEASEMFGEIPIRATLRRVVSLVQEQFSMALLSNKATDILQLKERASLDKR